MIQLNFSNRNKIIIAVIIFFAFGFAVGFGLGAFQTINWVVDTFLKILNSRNGAQLIQDLLRLRSVGNVTPYMQ
jgi:hypothetical protein